MTITTDIHELNRVRRRQIMYLGRYGKQPITIWDEMDITEFLAHHQALSDIVRDENGETGT